MRRREAGGPCATELRSVCSELGVDAARFTIGVRVAKPLGKVLTVIVQILYFPLCRPSEAGFQGKCPLPSCLEPSDGFPAARACR